MPYDFAEQLFNVTTLGLRVIVAPSEVAPVEFAHPALFPPKSDTGAVAAARAAEADEAAKKADQAKLAAVTASREAARAMMPVRVAENLKQRAEAQLAAAEHAVLSTHPRRAYGVRTTASHLDTSLRLAAHEDHKIRPLAGLRAQRLV